MPHPGLDFPCLLQPDFRREIVLHTVPSLKLSQLEVVSFYYSEVINKVKATVKNEHISSSGKSMHLCHLWQRAVKTLKRMFSK